MQPDDRVVLNRVEDRRVFEILRRDLPDFETYIAEVMTHIGPGASPSGPG